MNKKLLIILLILAGMWMVIKSSKLTSAAAQTAPPVYLWVEAESGNLPSSIQSLNDSSASENHYIQSGNNSIASPPAAGSVVYKFKIKKAGTYKVWGRVIAPTTASDSFWVRLDKEPWIKWDNLPASTNWRWDDLHNSDASDAVATFNLTAKKYKLTVAYREAGTKLDRLLITNDLSFVPTGTGTGGCAVTGTSALWADFVNARQTGTEPVLPDFSYAGYHYSEKPIPDVAGTIFNVTSHGATPNDATFDDAGIQAAIDAAEAAGGGVVLFPAGKYLVNPTEDSKHFITIQGSNIVLRGAGSGDGGTEILMVAKKQGGSMFQISPTSWGATTVANITANATRETFWVTVDSTSQLRVGQRVIIRYQSPEYNNFYYAGMALDPDWKRVVNNGVGIHEMHQIAEIADNRIRFREPLHFTLRMGSTPHRLEAVKPLEEVGIEDIRFTGSWDTYPETFVHHKDWIHDTAWSLLSIKQTANGWLRRCEFRHFNSGVGTDAVVAFTVENIKFTGKKGHSSIGGRRGYGLLVKDSEDTAGTHHGPDTGYNLVGAVYLRYKMMVNQAVDNHGGVPHAILLDQVTGGVLSGNGGPIDNYPHTGRYYTLWNFAHRSTSSKNYDFWDNVNRNSNTFALPIFAGFTHDNAVTFQSQNTEIQRNESFGTPVTPGSLFEAQLQLRLCR